MQGRGAGRALYSRAARWGAGGWASAAWVARARIEAKAAEQSGQTSGGGAAARDAEGNASQNTLPAWGPAFAGAGRGAAGRAPKAVWYSAPTRGAALAADTERSGGECASGK